MRYPFSTSPNLSQMNFGRRRTMCLATGGGISAHRPLILLYASCQAETVKELLKQSIMSHVSCLGGEGKTDER
jgi:hypothetical protein